MASIVEVLLEKLKKIEKKILDKFECSNCSPAESGLMM